MPVISSGINFIQNASVGYKAYVLTANLTLVWPNSFQDSPNVIAAFTNFTSVSSAGLSVTLPDATQVSVGTQVILSNITTTNIFIKDNSGASLITLQGGTTNNIFQLTLTDNTTAAGEWFPVAYGVGTSSASATQLAGFGVEALSIPFGVNPVTLNSASLVTILPSGDFTFTGNSRAGTFIYNQSVSATLTLPAFSTSAQVVDGFWLAVNNIGGTALSFATAGTINGQPANTFLLNVGCSCIFVFDGTNWWTVGVTPADTPNFTTHTIDISGSSNYTLTTAQAKAQFINLTGTISGSITVFFPITTFEWIVQNATTGASGVTLQLSSGGTPYSLPATERQIFYCDGTNFYNITTSTSTNGLFNAGSAAAPSITFTVDTRSGFYLQSIGAPAVTANGSQIAQFTNGQLQLLQTNVTSPVLASITNPTTGIAFGSVNDVDIVSNGSPVAQFSGNDVNFEVPALFKFGTALLPGIAFAGDNETGLYRKAANELAFTSSGTLSAYFLNQTLFFTTQGETDPIIASQDDVKSGISFSDSITAGLISTNLVINNIPIFSIDTDGASFQLQMLAEDDGVVTAPSYSFSSSDNTGIYLSGDGTPITDPYILNFAVIGIDVFSLVSTNVFINKPAFALNGTAALPAYAFNNAPDTGVYLSSTTPHTLGLTAGGVAGITITSTAINFLHPVSVTTTFIAPNGTAAAPSFSFTNAPDTGMYLPSAAPHTLGLSAGGTEVIGMTATAVNTLVAATFSSTIAGANGTAALPEHTFTADLTSGMYLSSVGTLGLSAGGVAAITMTSTAINFLHPVSVSTTFIAPNGTAAAPSFTFTNAPDTGIYLASASPHTLGISAGGTQVVGMTSTAVSTFVAAAFGSTITAVNGTAANPEYTFTADPASGLYLSGVGIIGLTAGGVASLTSTSTIISFLKPSAFTSTIRGANGTAALPEFSFTADNTSGMYLSAVGTLAFSASATSVMTMTSTAITFLVPATHVSLAVGNGSATTPSYTFTNSTNTGIYLPTVGTLGLTAGGSEGLSVTSTAVNLLKATALTSTIAGVNGTAALPEYTFTADLTSGMYLSAVGTLGLTAGGVAAITMTSTAINFLQPVAFTSFLGAAGTVGAPTYSFSTSTNTGTYLPAVGTLGFSAGGIQGLNLTSTTITANLPISGTSLALTTPLPITSGGTGANNKTTAFNNLAPTAAAGDTIYNNGTNNVALAMPARAGSAMVTNNTSNAPAWTGHGILTYPTIVTSTTGTAITTGAATTYTNTGMPSITITTTSANSVVNLAFSGSFSGSVNPTTNLYLQWRRNGTPLAGAIGTGTPAASQIVSLSYSAGLGGSVANGSAVSMVYVDTPGAAGTYTYQIYTAASTAPGTNNYYINRDIAGTYTGCMVMSAYEIGGF